MSKKARPIMCHIKKTPSNGQESPRIPNRLEKAIGDVLMHMNTDY